MDRAREALVRLRCPVASNFSCLGCGGPGTRAPEIPNVQVVPVAYGGAKRRRRRGLASGGRAPWCRCRSGNRNTMRVRCTVRTWRIRAGSGTGTSGYDRQRRFDDPRRRPCPDFAPVLRPGRCSSSRHAELSLPQRDAVTLLCQYAYRPTALFGEPSARRTAPGVSARRGRVVCDCARRRSAGCVRWSWRSLRRSRRIRGPGPADADRVRIASSGPSRARVARRARGRLRRGAVPAGASSLPAPAANCHQYSAASHFLSA